MNCPNCNSNNISKTLMGKWCIGHSSRDDINTATCQSCGHRDLAYLFGAEDFKPMSGTENWTEAQIEKWYKDFDLGKIEFVESPGIAIYNPKAIAQIKI